MVNYPQMQKIVERQIRNFGGGANNGILRRGAEDRTCSVVILQFTEQERQGNLVQWGDKKVLISGLNLTVPPDNELDTIVLNDVEHKIAQPPVPLAPDGSTVLYWEVIARK